MKSLSTTLHRCASQQVCRRFFGSSTSLATAASFDKIGVIGLGLMGHGIAQVAATVGPHSQVVAFEKETQFLERGQERIEKSIDKLVQKEKLTAEQAEKALSKLVFTTDMDALQQTEFIVEAVIENMDLKKDLYTALGEQMPPDTIFASNTSSLSITEMAQFSGRPQNFVGVHFFNPVQIMKLVEVIKTEQTDPAVFDKASHWVQDIQKVPVSCGDTPGKIEFWSIRVAIACFVGSSSHFYIIYYRFHCQSSLGAISLAGHADGRPKRCFRHRH